MTTSPHEPPGAPRSARQEFNARRGLPRRPILYTLDQIADMLSLSVKDLKESYVWLESEDFGVYRPRFLRAVNIALATQKRFTKNPGHSAEYRVAEHELIRWLTYHDLWIYPE